MKKNLKNLLLFLILILFNELIGQMHFTFNETEDYYGIIVNSATINGYSLENGDEVGVFFRDNNDILVCGGAEIWPTHGLSAWGDDSQTIEKDGFDIGELMVFKFYDTSEAIEFDNVNAFFSLGDCTYGNGAYGICNLDASSHSNITKHLAEIPTHYRLYQNYPNPFNTMTTIQYNIVEPGYVILVIYGINGQIIKHLVSRHKDAGFHRIVWDGTNESGNKVTSGVYLYTLKAGEFKSIKKMAFVR